jgi:cell pole-organizing protein PopZ
MSLFQAYDGDSPKWRFVMGEAAVKEPSMEDILSSIRKIISEEGSAPVVEQPAAAAEMPAPEVAAETAPSPQMSDVLEQVRSDATQVETVAAAPAPDEISGNQAAKMAASLANIAETVKSEPAPEPVLETPMQQAAEVQATEPEPEQSVWDDVTETVSEQPVMETPEHVETQATPSLASIAETVVEQVEVPVSETTEVASHAEAPIHVEMAEATPAPDYEAAEEIEAPVSTAAVETMVEEEMAFKGALMSPSADGAVSGAFDRLKRSAMDDIDAKTEAILRPMLREWLDENLPNMVERLVREEIERVARGV